MYSYPLEALNEDDKDAAVSKRGRKICHANFFRAGVCQGQQLVCCVKTSGLSTTIKAYEPMDSMTKKSKKSSLAKMLSGSQDVLSPLKVCLSLPILRITVTNLVRYRSSTSPPNQPAYTSSAQNSASAASAASKLSHSKPSKPNPSSTKPTHPSTSSSAKSPSNPSTSSVSSKTSCSATPTTHSLSIGTVGGRDRTGSSNGKVHLKLSPSSISTFLLLRRILLRFGIWRVGLWCIF